MQDELTDAQLARLLAEAMGLDFLRSLPDVAYDWVEGRLVHLDGFDPANDWRDFGRVWEWAKSRKMLPSLMHGMAGAWGRDVGHCTAHDPNELRAFCLALCRALGVA